MFSCSESTFGAQQYVLLGGLVIAVALGTVSKHKKEFLPLSLLTLNAIVGLSRHRGSIYYYVVQPLLLVISAFFLYNKHGKLAQLFGAAYLVAVAVITAAVEPCDSSNWLYVPDGIAGVYLVFGVGTHFNAVYPAWCLMESAILAVLLASASLTEVVLRAEHLTWWSLMFFGVWELVIFCEYFVNKNQPHRTVTIVTYLTPAVLTLNLIVLVGVYFMSATSCNLLSDALKEAGDFWYIIGNFAMHYYPLLRTLFGTSCHSLNAVGKGAAIAVLYAVCYPATDVYGCAQPAPEYVPIVIAGVAIMLAILYSAACEFYMYTRDEQSSLFRPDKRPT
jgi:hypothetical protein